MKKRNEEDYEEYWDETIPNFNPLQTIYNDGCKAIEFTVLSDIYNKEEIEEDGELVEKYTLIKKECPSKRVILKEDIIGVNEVLNTKGNVKRSLVELNIRHQESVIVKGNYSKLKHELFYAKANPAGFKFY